MGHSEYDPAFRERRAWNEGRKLGAKRPLKPKQVWAIRFWLDGQRRVRDRALFDLAIDSKLRGCDLVKVRIGEPKLIPLHHRSLFGDLESEIGPRRNPVYGSGA